MKSTKKATPLVPGRGLHNPRETIPTMAAGRGESNATAGDPIPTTAAGRGELNATAGISQVRAAGLASLKATGAARGQPGTPRLPECPTTTKPKGGCQQKSGEVPLNVKPSTSKAASVLAGKQPAKTPASGATGSGMAKSSQPVKASQVPFVKEGTATESSCSNPTPPPATSGNPLSASRHKNDSRRAALKKRSAKRFISGLGSKPADQLTNEQAATLAWAKAYVELPAKPPHAPTKEAMPKRQRSEEEAAAATQQPDPKRPKPAPRTDNRSFSEVIKNNLTRAIVNRSDSDGAISHDQWDVVNHKLSGVFWRILKENPGPPPQCADAGWYHGRVKLMACADERSASLLKLAITAIGEAWDGARLEVIPTDEIPKRPRSIAVIPSEPSTPEEILEILQCCNPQLPTNDWKVVKVTEAEGLKRNVIVVLNHESLEPLRERRGRVFYCFSEIVLRIYRSDNKGNRDPMVDNDMLSSDDVLSLGGNETASACGSEDTQSISDMVGAFFEHMDMVDEDALLDSEPEDQEDVNVTVVENMEHGEGDADKPSPL